MLGEQYLTTADTLVRVARSMLTRRSRIGSRRLPKSTSGEPSKR